MVLASEEDAKLTEDENFSQFSDNAVLSPPTTDSQQVLPTNCAVSLITDDEQLLLPSREIMTTTTSSLSHSPSQQDSLDGNLNELESPDLENQIFLPRPLRDEGAADTIIISSSTESNKERPITTSGLFLRYHTSQSYTST